MLPRNSNLDPDPPEFPPASRAPRWLLIVSVVTMLVVMGLGYLSLRVVQRIRQFKRLAAQIQADYEATEQRYPFEPPAEPRAPGPDRLEAYLRARASFASTIDARTEEKVATLLQSERPANVGDVARLYVLFYDFLAAGTEAHLQALEQERMGPTEFFWIHGYLLRDVLEGPEGDPRRRLEEALDSLERHSAPIGGSTRNFEAQEFRALVDRRYTGYPSLGPGVPAGYRVEGELMACMDIIGASPGLTEGLGLKEMAAPTPESVPATLRSADEESRDGTPTARL